MWQIVFTAALLFQPPQAAGPTPDELVQQGTQALDESRYDDAVEILTRAVAAAPEDYFVHFNLAVAYSLLGKDAQAVPEYKRVLELKPGLYEANINLGQVLVRSGDPTAAIPYLTEARRQKPAEVRPAYYLAEAYLATNQPAQAVEPYTAALAIEPTDASAELGLGRAYFQTGRLADAEPHYQKAAQLDPNLKSFLMELATGYEEHGDRAAALKLFREFPGDPAVEERMGVLLLQSGDLEGAIAALESAVKASPTKGNQTALVQAYMDHKDIARAEAVMQRIVAAEPQDFDLRMYYARLLRDQHKIVPAAQQFQAAAQIKPDDAKVWSELAGMLILAEQYPAALAALDRARDLGLEGPGHLFFRATTLDHLQARKEALEYYQKFLEASQGKNPDQEFQARQRVLALERDLGKR